MRAPVCTGLDSLLSAVASHDSGACKTMVGRLKQQLQLSGANILPITKKAVLEAKDCGRRLP